MPKLSHLPVVLHVEDELLISMNTDDALHEAGVAKVLHAATVDGALALIRSEMIDAAVVDMQLRDGESRPVIEALKAAHIPFIIVSGAPIRAADADLGAFRINKPISNEQLVVALQRIRAYDFELFDERRPSGQGAAISA